MKTLDLEKLPRHVAIIMDGNGVGPNTGMNRIRATRRRGVRKSDCPGDPRDRYSLAHPLRLFRRELEEAESRSRSPHGAPEAISPVRSKGNARQWNSVSGDRKTPQALEGRSKNAP